MRAFKSFMRGTVAFLTLCGIIIGLGCWIGRDVAAPGNFGTKLLWSAGLFVVSFLVWFVLTWFIIWLTDGKWELDEEESEDED